MSIYNAVFIACCTSLEGLGLDSKTASTHTRLKTVVLAVKHRRVLTLNLSGAERCERCSTLVLGLSGPLRKNQRVGEPLVIVTLEMKLEESGKGFRQAGYVI